MRRTHHLALSTPLGLLALLAAGCLVSIEPGPGGGGGGGQPPRRVTVRVVNNTATTLDPEIHVADALVGVEELFLAERKYTRFGVGTLGLLGPGNVDEFTLECAGAVMIGTRGGSFGDDLTNPDGRGRQIVLTQEQSFFCDGRVTFTYQRDGAGFTTTFSVSP